MNLTTKQRYILRLIVDGNPDGTPIDFDELIERLPYTTSKDSMHFSMRALAAKGLAEKGPMELRRDRQRRTIVPTPLGRHWAAALCPSFTPGRVPVPEVELDDPLAEAPYVPDPELMAL